MLALAVAAVTVMVMVVRHGEKKMLDVGEVVEDSEGRLEEP